MTLLVLVLVQAWPEDMVSALNVSADPCQDFYEFACGGWQNETEIPSWQSGWAKQVSHSPQVLLPSTHFAQSLI
jgi:hypothetical protein